MREEKLVVYPFEDFKITDCIGLKQVNEHTWIELSGEIPFDKKGDYMLQGLKNTAVQVMAFSQENSYPLFIGIIQEMKLIVKNSICTMHLRLISGTYRMDSLERLRSFQNSDSTFSQLIDICNEDHEQSGRIITVGREDPIGQLLIQYKETDWAFVKRLASINNTVVIADCSTQGIKYYFGLPNRKSEIQGDLVEYQTQFNIGEYWDKKEGGIKLSQEDTLSYVWESREIYELGDWKMIDGKKRVVWMIETKMKGNELYHRYYLKLASGIQTIKQHNQNLSGISLMGTVKKIKNEKVQIELFNDENQAHGERWFPYASVYSAEDGTGWYCMPEKGDKVRLYFPTEREEEAYVISAFHDEADLRVQPEYKFWRNKEGKEVRLGPESILLTNNDGTYIELTDEDGIEIVSQGSVSIRAAQNLNIVSSNASIELNAAKSIKVKQADTEMNLGGDIRMQGARIKL